MTGPRRTAPRSTEKLLSSQLLGFSAEERILIINADDLGMYPELNTAVLDSVEHGIASSCSVMPPCPGAAQALELLSIRSQIPFGIHLTLVSESPGLLFAPLSPRGRVPSLVDDDGHLHLSQDRESLLLDAAIDEVELELRAQIDSVLETGLSPTHLDWHSLADGGRDDILEVGLHLAREYGLAARVWLEPGRQRARGRGLPVVDHPFLDSFALDVDSKPERYATLLRELPPGLSEWAVHPGPGSPRARAIDPGWTVRTSDLAYLVSPEASEQLRQEDIRVIDYRALQEAWSKQPP